MNKESGIQGAVGKYNRYCSGFTEGIHDSYVLAPTLGIATYPIRYAHGEEAYNTLDGILAFDTAETALIGDHGELGPYFGQINLRNVSSFVSPEGFIWGYHLVPPEDHVHAPFEQGPRVIYEHGRTIPISSADHLLRATQALFGTKDEHNFPIHPGAMIDGATQVLKEAGPVHLYAAFGIGIPAEGSVAASLLMETTGIVPDDISQDSATTARFLSERIEAVAHSILEVGKNNIEVLHGQPVEYQHILVGLRDRRVEPGYVGCALVALLYVTLAKDAVIRDDGTSRPLESMTLAEWKQDL